MPFIQAFGRDASTTTSNRKARVLHREHVLEQVRHLLLLCLLLLHLQLHEPEQLPQVRSFHGGIRRKTWRWMVGSSSLERHCKA